ncbi:peptidase M23 family protein [Lysobacter capsici]|uniref:M23 family metallopeptidase n=1 Tax=Lysobacter capsici TaxID=435897 RepID=UPI0007165B85|nr:M23 family metallopeptidase [Lysobacter capsici]ALN87697.1 peptidase M23 family protein [Lysobacter capsici]
MTHPSRRALALASFAVLGLAATGAQAAPNFQMPFACGDTWVANTWSGHSPANSVDMNRPAGGGSTAGSTVVASAAGEVTVSTYSTTTGYGNYVVIDHGGGWKTLHAHLQSRAVSVGAKVKQGQKIGLVGNTSAKYELAPHLHYEQVYNGSVQKAKWDGVALRYFEKKNYKSKNSCATSSGGATGVVGTSGAALNVRSGAGTNYSVVDTVANGSSVNIRCQKTGESISGTYGTSALWNNIGASGSNRYIPDAYTKTGPDGRVAPDC